MSQTLNVLLVEDESVLRRCLAAHLETRGARVQAAGSLEEANSLLENHHFDVAILDVGLPDGDGLSLLDRTRRETSVVITAQPDPQRFEEQGVRFSLEKPLDLDEVSRVVARAAA